MKYDIQNPMTEEEMLKLHQTSLAILEETGMQIDHAVARSRLHDAGAIVEDKKNRVRFPASMVEDCIRKIPKTICLAGRDPEYDLILSYDRSFVVRCATGLTAIFNHATGDCRDAVISDQHELSTLADALGHIDMAAPLTLHGVPGKTADLHATKVLLENQRKHFMNLTMGSRNMRYQVEMQLAVRGSREEIKKRPLFHPIACLISPLYIPVDDIEIMMIAGEYGLPLKMPVMPMLGASAPVTLAGTLALGNAEVLGAFSVLQTLYPGNPTLYYLVPAVMDMRSGGSVYAAPENSLLYAAIIQMARSFYKVPSDTTALFTDGVLLEQATYQKGTNLQTAALCGANIISGAGTVDGGMAFSPQQLVIDDEMIAFTHRMMSGFEINDDTLALDCIKRVGPKGVFLDDPHTFEHMRGHNVYSPKVFSYKTYSAWKDDAERMPEKAQAKIRDILDTHEVPPLEDHIVRELGRILKAADEKIV